MKNLVIVLLGLLTIKYSFGQDLNVKTKIDTLSIIQTVDIPTKEIAFEIPYGIVYISKASLIETWVNELALWEDEIENNPRNKDWQLENYKQSESYLEFVKRKDRLFFKYCSTKYDSIYQIPQIEELRPETDTLFYIENQLKEIACNLLDIGEFEVNVDNKKIGKVIKAKVTRTSKFSAAISTEYIVNDTIHFWICTPIIHSDFVIEENIENE